MATAPLSEDDRAPSGSHPSHPAPATDPPTDPPTGTPTGTPTGASTASRSRRSTAHLKEVPPTKQLREQLRQYCREITAGLDKQLPLTKDEMERVVRELLKTRELPEAYLGWTMVALASAFWEDQVAATPPSRRLFLLPHCLKHAEGCPADYDQFGLDCESCGACSIADFRAEAQRMGYKVLVAEGSPIVMKIIVSGHVDAILGVACLNVLEKAIDKILLAGIPCTAVPLLSSDCRNTSVDEDWVTEMIRSHRPSLADPDESQGKTRSYLHLMRQAAKMFEPESLVRLIPPVRGGVTAEGGTPSLQKVNSDPLAATEAIAYDFLARGGKHSRPFITLAVYDALTGGRGTRRDGAEFLKQLPWAVKRAAASIEVFHKASLVHDDIEDNDPFRYGDPSVHRQYGVPTAINVGDYLIGLGYRLVSREIPSLGAEVVADTLDALADAHLKLTEGQGAELVWRDGRDKRLTPLDALKIYALKTSPAFEAALYVGWRLAIGDGESTAGDGASKTGDGSSTAGDGASTTNDRLFAEADGALAAPLKLFARHVGVAFQILNDLKDWEGDQDNKMTAGGDVLGGRPTLLLALALDALDVPSQSELIALVEGDMIEGDMIEGGTRPEGERIARVGQLYRDAGVFETARRLVDKHRKRAETAADEVANDQLRRLLHYLCDTILKCETQPSSVNVVTPSWWDSPVGNQPPTPATGEV